MYETTKQACELACIDQAPTRLALRPAVRPAVTPRPQDALPLGARVHGGAGAAAAAGRAQLRALRELRDALAGALRIEPPPGVFRCVHVVMTVNDIVGRECSYDWTDTA